jgi:hypothetical protein
MMLLRCAPAALLLVACEVAAGGKPVAAPGSEPGQRIPAFEREGIALSPEGAPMRVALSSRRLARPTAYVFLGTHCGTTARYLGRIAALERAYASKIDFVHVYPNQTDSSEQKRDFHRRHALRGPMIDDQGAQVARLLGGQRTAEAVLVRRDGVVLYRGALDDSADEARVTRRHLAAAADEHLAGKPVSLPKTVGTA